MAVILVKKKFVANPTFDKLKLWVIPVGIKTDKRKSEFDFLLDTGAQRTIITPKIKKNLGLQEGTEKTVRGRGITGSCQYSTAIANLEIGSIPLIEVPVLVGSFPNKHQIVGILGADVLQLLSLKIDYPEGILEIARLIPTIKL